MAVDDEAAGIKANADGDATDSSAAASYDDDGGSSRGSSHVHSPRNPNPSPRALPPVVSSSSSSSAVAEAAAACGGGVTTTTTTVPQPTSGPGSGKGIDAHPYSRGSVIEVLYVQRRSRDKRSFSASAPPRKLPSDGDDYDDDDIVGDEDARGCRGGMMLQDYEYCYYGDDHRLDGCGIRYANDGDPWDDVDDSDISDWFASDDDGGEEVGDGGRNGDARTKSSSNDGRNVDDSNVHLADVIDRVPLYPHLENSHPSQRFRYYIHYRDFNRRMDEWITMERIVSPPSIGNAKMRALKKMEERRKREDEERKQRGRMMNDVGFPASVSSSFSVGVGGVDVAGGSGIFDGSPASDFVGGGAGTAVGAAPRKRLRRNVSSAFGAVEDLVGDVATSSGVKPSLSTGSEVLEAEAAAGRLTRRQRGAGGVVGEIGPGSSGIASSAVGMMMVAEDHTAVDVVTTIAAPVLDEHEGMDAAALKEHEEVTKVKNVNTLELGKFRMDTWYFSPLPKELLRDASGSSGGSSGMIDVLYVDEFSFNFFTRKEELLRYQQKTFALGKRTTDRRHPPGNEIYRCGNLSSEWMHFEHVNITFAYFLCDTLLPMSNISSLCP